MSPDRQVEHEARKIVESLTSAWNVHDARAFAANFAQDADFTNVFGMPATGRDAIERFHAPIFETMFKDSHLTATNLRVRPVRADVAAVDLRWEMTGARDPMGNEWPCRRGLINMLVTREEGDWAIAVMHNMELASDEMAEAQEALQSVDR